MENQELAQCLKEVFTILNEEAKLVGSATAERCMGQVLDGPGMDWLLDTAQAWNLVNVGEVRQNAQAYRDLLRSEAGRGELRLQLKQRQQEIQKWRRRLVSHMKAWQTSRQSLELQFNELANGKEIYGLLIKNCNKQGGVKDEDSVHGN